MRLGGLIALLLASNAAGADPLTTFRVARVNACLGMQAAPADRIDRQVDDGSVLSVATTLAFPDLQGQFSIDGSAQAGYGILHARMFSALDSAATFTEGSSHAQAGFADIITISSPAWNGQPGLLYLSYSLSGNGSTSGQSASFATVRILAGVSLEQQQTMLHSGSEWGRFWLSQPIRFTYGVPLGLELMLETTNRVEAHGVAAKNAESATSNLVEGLALTGLIPADQQGKPVTGAQFTSASGTQYGVDGVASSEPPPADAPPVISSIKPTSAPAGTTVTVSGKGFLPTSGRFDGSGGDIGGNTVNLGSDVAIKNQNSQDGLTLQFQIPPNLAPGTYSLSITNQNGSSNTVNLTVTSLQ